MAVSTKMMTYVAAERLFVTEASDLTGQFERAYQDACDVGFTLISHRTGREIRFVESEEKRDADGELLWTDFIPADRKDRATNIRVRVFND